jgi:hypothetical protein
MLRKEASRRFQVRPISTLYRTEQKELHFLKIWAFLSKLNRELWMLAVLLENGYHQLGDSAVDRLAAMGSACCDVLHENIGGTNEVSDC